MKGEIFSPVDEFRVVLFHLYSERGAGGGETYMRSEVSLQIASLLEGLGASDKRTDKVTFQICLKV